MCTHLTGFAVMHASWPVHLYHIRIGHVDMQICITYRAVSRYLVKYGSAGFLSFGYQAGCNFVDGRFASEDPDSARYLCSSEPRGKLLCQHDHSTAGVCSRQGLGEFSRVVSVCPLLRITNLEAIV